MKEQYLAQFQNGFCEKNVWLNAKTYLSYNESRFCKTKKEAEEWLNKVIKESQKLATKKHTLGKPPFSIESEPDEKHLVVNTRIRKRIVSEWEEV